MQGMQFAWREHGSDSIALCESTFQVDVIILIGLQKFISKYIDVTRPTSNEESSSEEVENVQEDEGQSC